MKLYFKPKTRSNAIFNHCVYIYAYSNTEQNSLVHSIQMLIYSAWLSLVD